MEAESTLGTYTSNKSVSTVSTKPITCIPHLPDNLSIL